MKIRTWALTILIIGAWLACSSAPVWAQFNSAIEGTVTDPSGGAVPNAKVTIKNLATSHEETVSTTALGYYRFNSLPAARFDVTAAASGFETTVEPGVVLAVSEIKVVNLTLSLGTASTQLTVSAAAPAVETSEGRVTGVIQEAQVHDLPLSGRNFYDLVVTTPGVTGLAVGGGQSYAQASGDIFNPEFGVNLNANGQRAEANNYLVDSASVESGQTGSIVNVNPNAEDVQEVRVSVNDFSAEWGRASSALVNVLTKSGSNQFHGVMDEFHTDNVLQSRNIFQLPSGPIYRRNEFGGAFGGPIRKDRTFFFASTDILKSGAGTGLIKSYFTPQFTSLVEQNFPNNISAGLLQKYPANLVPVNGFLTAGQQSGVDCSTLATPGTAITTPLGSLPCNEALAGNGVLNITLPRNGAQWTARVDHNLSNSKDRFYFSINRTNLTKVLFDSPGVNNTFNQPQPTYTMYMNLNETHVFSPNLVNEAAISYVRAAGVAPVADPQVPGIYLNSMIGGYNNGTIFGDAWGPNTFHQNNFEWRDVASYNRGSHSLKAGVDYQHTQSNQNFSQLETRPSYTFFNVYDFALDKPDVQTYVGINPLTGGPANDYSGERFGELGIFGQDAWKIRSNFTLNYGVRWETFGNPSDQNGTLSNVVFPSGHNSFTYNIANASNAVVKHVFNNPPNLWTPRLSFAWDPSKKGKLSIRGGAGMFALRFNQQWWNGTAFNPPFAAGVTASVFTPSDLPVYSLGCAQYPFCFPLPTGVRGAPGLNSHGGLAGVQGSVSWTDPNTKPAYAENYFFGIQYGFKGNWTAEADYIGSTAHHLYGGYDVNRTDGDLITYNNVYTPPNPYFGPITYAQAQDNSVYNGMTLAIKNRFSHGLTFQGSYVYGKAIDEGSISNPGQLNVDVGNHQRDRALADFDVRNRFTASLTWLVPSRNLHYKVANGLTNGWELASITILQSGNPFTVTCSAPFNPVYNNLGTIVGNSGCDFNADGNDQDLPMMPAFGNSLHHPSRTQFINGVFNCQSGVPYCENVFPAPPLGQEGNLGRNTFTGPGFAGTDLSLIKNNKIPWFWGNEKANFQIRFETFNVFNRVNVSGLSTDMAASNLGSATSTYGARNFQIGLRLAF